MSEAAVQRALRRLDSHDDQLRRIRYLVDLLADAVGVDVRRLEQIERVARRGGHVVSWDEAVAVGMDPVTGVVRR